MNQKTYIIFTKAGQGAASTIKIKSTGYVIVSSNQQVKFEDGGQGVAVFNMNEIVGFVESDHIVN